MKTTQVSGIDGEVVSTSSPQVPHRNLCGFLASAYAA
jgi:hypothetical protein